MLTFSKHAEYAMQKLNLTIFKHTLQTHFQPLFMTQEVFSAASLLASVILDFLPDSLLLWSLEAEDGLLEFAEVPEIFALCCRFLKEISKSR